MLKIIKPWEIYSFVCKFLKVFFFAGFDVLQFFSPQTEPNVQNWNKFYNENQCERLLTRIESNKLGKLENSGLHMFSHLNNVAGNVKHNVGSVRLWMLEINSYSCSSFFNESKNL